MDFIVDKQPNQETINAMQDALQSDNLETLYTDNIESLIEVDELLRADIKSGAVRIEKTEIIGTDDKEYDL